MRRTLKWLGIVLGSLLVLVVIAVAVLHFVGQSRLRTAPEVAARPVTIPTDAAAVARGEQLANAISICTGCHGPDLGGDVFLDGDLGSYVVAPNLTTGEGGVGATFSAEDWERAIRHGVGGDGRALIFMPSSLYSHYSDEDLGALLAYLQQVPPVDSDWEPRRMGFPGTIIAGVVAYDDFTHVNRIDHEQIGSTAAPPEGVTVEYGEYLLNIAACRECHAPNLAGVLPGGGAPAGPNLTPGGDLQDWSEADFITAIRTGITSEGEQLSEEMPWPFYSQMTDAELQALWAYLQSLPALPDNP